jgi:hypothetical protein
MSGSSFTEGVRKTINKKECNSFDTLNITMNTLKPERLWHNKTMNEKIDNDALYVKTLTQWDKEFFKANPIIKKNIPPKQNIKKIK